MRRLPTYIWLGGLVERKILGIEVIGHRLGGGLELPRELGHTHIPTPKDVVSGCLEAIRGGGY